MYFLFVHSVRSVPVLSLPVVTADKQPQQLFISRISSCEAFAAIKRAVSVRRGFVAIFASGETSCQ
jgi:hypothetical protein